MALNYVMLSELDKKLYRVHVRIFADRDDAHVCEVALNLTLFPVEKYRALRVATAGEVRRRHLSVVPN